MPNINTNIIFLVIWGFFFGILSKLSKHEIFHQLFVSLLFTVSLLHNPDMIIHSVPWCAMVQNPNLRQVTSINNLPTDTF